MPRPIKCRKVCHFPDILEFRPSNKNGGRGEEDEKEVILLTVDEYETIRLIDKEGYSQEQCAGFMQIARTTVQRIYEIARKKVADAIVDGHPLRIEGGDFRICDGKSSKCGLGGCYKQEFYQKYATEKGEGIMRVAVTYENGQITLADAPKITCQCLRVPVLNGHTAAVFINFEKKPTKEQLIEKLESFKGFPQEAGLPSAPKQFVRYMEEDNRPQVKLDVDYENGMGVSIGRLREDSMFDFKFVGLSHNTVRGAAGGAVLCAEALTAKGYIQAK